MNYHPSNCLVNNPTAITGRYLAHNRYDLISHAFFAADLFLGAKQLVKPTLTQAAVLARVNRAYASWAVQRFAERDQIEAGLVPLVPRRANARANALPAPISDAQLVSMIRSAGIERTLEIACSVENAA